MLGKEVHQDAVDPWYFCYSLLKNNFDDKYDYQYYMHLSVYAVYGIMQAGNG
jgi:hypothetical protein